jgi:DNA polymerase-3 subunit gamma/tau
MALLRMLAFRLTAVSDPMTSTPPAGKVAGSPVARPVPAQTKKPESAGPDSEFAVKEAAPLSNPVVSNQWDEIVPGLGLVGLTLQLADNSMMEHKDAYRIALVLDESFKQMHKREREQELQQALQNYFDSPGLKLELTIGKPNLETPAVKRKRMTDEQQQAAESAIKDDPNVKALEESFGAEVNPASIRPRA